MPQSSDRSIPVSKFDQIARDPTEPLDGQDVPGQHGVAKRVRHGQVFPTDESPRNVLRGPLAERTRTAARPRCCKR